MRLAASYLNIFSPSLVRLPAASTLYVTLVLAVLRVLVPRTSVTVCWNPSSRFVPSAMFRFWLAVLL